LKSIQTEKAKCTKCKAIAQLICGVPQGSNNTRERGNERRRRKGHGNIIEVVLEWLLELVEKP